MPAPTCKTCPRAALGFTSLFNYPLSPDKPQVKALPNAKIELDYSDQLKSATFKANAL